ncbi:DUF1638 domain-containing protein [Methylobacter sp.]|uniref:DUF1638 domain-containing protein n=1 Tax=Methylobacter sp. TaxID=2051955 RepID=UPI0024898BAE|nr:DUF1638 domain-containing protein [Methylobacter sp.]MDI1277930.1 DUF1638 domain-containing protein [Methylobacter sp.]MDI1358729.1 DUF1638 domain-containing protein [Methylobacter sp.]
MSPSTLSLVGCGILQKEVGYLIAKNNWPLTTDFLPASLHIDFKRLACALQAGLARHADEQTIVFYGACHPGMDKMLNEGRTLRTLGQNCVEMLLGAEEFNRELTQGAFFLLDDWVRNWDAVIAKTFGSNIAVIRDIFHDQHRYLLCLRTPQSGDFSREAARIGAMLDLPVHWRDVTLEHLESVLQTAIRHKLESLHDQ